MSMFAAGVFTVLFFGFLANRLGFLSVHKKAEKPASTGPRTVGSRSTDNVRKHID